MHFLQFLFSPFTVSFAHFWAWLRTLFSSILFHFDFCFLILKQFFLGRANGWARNIIKKKASSAHRKSEKRQNSNFSTLNVNLSIDATSNYRESDVCSIINYLQSTQERTLSHFIDRRTDVKSACECFFWFFIFYFF